MVSDLEPFILVATVTVVLEKILYLSVFTLFCLKSENIDKPYWIGYIILEKSDNRVFNRKHLEKG